MDRPKLEVADIFRRYGEVYRQNDGASLSTAQRRVMTAIEVCRTAALGGHLERCDSCSYERPCYDSCRDRHCPKCQSLARAEWVEKRKAEIGVGGAAEQKTGLRMAGARWDRRASFFPARPEGRKIGTHSTRTVGPSLSGLRCCQEEPTMIIGALAVGSRPMRLHSRPMYLQYIRRQLSSEQSPSPPHRA